MKKHLLKAFLLSTFLLFCLIGIQYVFRQDTIYISSGTFDRSFGLRGKKIVDKFYGYDLPALFKPLGYKVKTAKHKSMPNAKKIVVFEIFSPTRLTHLKKYPKEKMVLFLWEPPTVIPENYLPENHQYFSKIYTWNDDLVDNKTYFKFFYPEAKPMVKSPIPFAEKKLCTMISGPKKSTAKGELCSKREEVIVFFEENHGKDFDFYGRHWDQAIFKNYLGSVKTKACFHNYRFAICYENITGLKGYITEKIFDCFAWGIVPIYWGADNISDYIPSNCFIDRRNFGSNEELHQHLKLITEEEYECYLRNIEMFLKSKEASLFSPKHLINILQEAVDAL